MVTRGLLIALLLMGGLSCKDDGPNLVPYPAPPDSPQLALPADGAIDQSTSPALKWNASYGAESYYLQISKSNSFDSLVQDYAGLTGTSQQIAGLSNKMKYCWRVNAKNGTGTSGWSGIWSFTTIGTAPSIPALALPADGAIDQPTSPVLSWNPSSGATSYALQVSTTKSFDSCVVNDSGLTSSSHQVSGLANVTTFYWRVKAKNEYGVSGWSVSWQFTTVQLRYFMGGIIKYKQTGTPVFSGVLIQLDDAEWYSAQYGGCSYGFWNVSPGKHRIRITSPWTLAVDTTITVDHDANCWTQTLLYNFEITIGLAGNGRELVLPQGVGTTWEFSYLNSVGRPIGTTRRFGTHFWKIASLNVLGSKTQYQIVDIRDDSTFTSSPLHPSGSTVPSLDTVQFAITVSQDSITIDCPEIGTAFRSIPRFCLQSSDTLMFTWPDPQIQEYARYANHIGILEYYKHLSSNTSITEAFRFVRFGQ